MQAVIRECGIPLAANPQAALFYPATRQRQSLFQIFQRPGNYHHRVQLANAFGFVHPRFYRYSHICYRTANNCRTQTPTNFLVSC